MSKFETCHIDTIDHRKNISTNSSAINYSRIGTSDIFHQSSTSSIFLTVFPTSAQLEEQFELDENQRHRSLTLTTTESKEKKHRKTASTTTTSIDLDNSSTPLHQLSFDEQQDAKQLTTFSKLSRSRSFHLLTGLKPDRNLSSSIKSNDETHQNSNESNLKLPNAMPQQSCLLNLLVQPQLSLTSATLHLNSTEHQQSKKTIEYYHQRQKEFDRVVTVLINVFQRKIVENLDRITYYWIDLKQLSLDQYQDENACYQLFDLLFKYHHKSMDFLTFLKANDDIYAAVQVLKTSLYIMREDYSLIRIKQLFDDEEKDNRDRTKYQTNILLTSYRNSHNLIKERISYYQSLRSEERRVGKECRSRWSPYH